MGPVKKFAMKLIRQAADSLVRQHGQRKRAEKLGEAANPIPRYPITAAIALGFGSAALHFLRQLFGRAA